MPTKIYLNMLGLNWEEIILQDTNPDLLKEVVEILKMDSQAHTKLRAFGGISKREQALKAAAAKDPGRLPSVGTPQPELTQAKFDRQEVDERALITPEFLERLIRVGTCASESSSLKAYVKRLDNIVRAMNNATVRYHLFLEQWQHLYAAANYDEAVAGRGELEPKEDFCRRGDEILGKAEKGCLYCAG